MVVINYDQSELDAVARQILDAAKSKTILFYGDMGAGKTTLIKALIKALGAEDTGSSPTFSLVNEYDSPQGPIFHFDFYRIEDEIEALDMGLEDYLYADAWIFIEWPQKVEKFLDATAEKVEITNSSKSNRKLKLC